DAFDLVRMDVAGVQRALGVGTNDLDLRILFLEEGARAARGAARAHADDEVRDPAVGLLPELGAGRAVVRLGVHRVVVLIRQEAARRFTRDALSDLVIGLGRLRRHRGRAHHDIGAERAQQIALLLALLVGHRADEAVSLDPGGHGQTHTGVAARRLDDRPAGLEQALALGVLDHAQTDAVLYRAAWVEVLHLRDDRRLEAAADPRESDEGGVSNECPDVGCG